MTMKRCVILKNLIPILAPSWNFKQWEEKIIFYNIIKEENFKKQISQSIPKIYREKRKERCLYAAQLHQKGARILLHLSIRNHGRNLTCQKEKMAFMDTTRIYGQK